MVGQVEKVPSMSIVSEVNSIFSCSADANKSILCRLVIILSTTKKSRFLNVLLKGSSISNICVVGIVGVMARRALLSPLSKKYPTNSLNKNNIKPIFSYSFHVHLVTWLLPKELTSILHILRHKYVEQVLSHF
jgi:hypothetical protein